MFCTTSNNASNYGDINPGLPDEDVSTCDKNEDKNLNKCNSKITKENEHSSNLPHFKTIVTSRTNGRLGNNLFSYMHLMCVELNFNVTILAEKVVKQSLVTFFKNVDNIPTADDDACGYYEFRNLSGCVLKILTAGKILQISIAWCQIEAEIRSFPTMYGKGGHMW